MLSTLDYILKLIAFAFNQVVMNRNLSEWMIVVLLLMAPSFARAQERTKMAMNTIRLGSIQNNSAFMLKQVEAPLVAIVFISPECPLSQNYMLTLNQLQQKFSNKLTIIGVFPGTDYKDEKYTDFEKKYQVKFRLVKDENKML